MVSLFYDLLAFFGISADAPQNLSEFFPWFLAIVVAVALFLFVFGIIKDFTHTFARGVASDERIYGASSGRRAHYAGSLPHCTADCVSSFSNRLQRYQRLVLLPAPPGLA
ncbi:hypothetical protein NIA69_21000 [Gemmiger formicilis]|nr:hypothetical protein [Gemmiger formicilis]